MRTTLIVVCTIALAAASAAQARPRSLGPYRVCGYEYTVAKEKCAGALVVDSDHIYTIKVVPLKHGAWDDASEAFQASKVVRVSDPLYFYYKMKMGQQKN